MTTFTPIFVTSTSSLLTYLKIKKIEGGKISQPTHPIIFKKSSAVLCIFVQYFSLQITTIILALKFPNFKDQSIITFDLKPVDKFWRHICKKADYSYKRLKENRKGKNITTHQPIPPPTQKKKCTSVRRSLRFFRCFCALHHVLCNVIEFW